MGNISSENSTKLANRRRRKQIWHRIVSAMAAVVVFCTTYALILPAITMTKEYYCGLQEHKHTQKCYGGNEIKISVCTATPHQHSDDCFDASGNVICGYADFFIHSHSEICYNGNRLVCNIPERMPHRHTENCYLGKTVYSCGLTEMDLHSHSDDCYESGQVLRCQLTEGEPHRHTEGCMVISEPVLVCPKVEVVLNCHTSDCCAHTYCGSLIAQEHIHTEDCFVKEASSDPDLICQIPEHIHETICTSDKTADLETAEIWRTTIPSADSLRGIPGEDLVTVAKSQIGYQESSRNFIIDENGERKGYTRYGQWYGEPYGDWSAMYASFCLYYINIPKTVFPYESSSQRWADALKELELYRTVQEYHPAVGDIVFCGTEIAEYVGIVTEVNSTQIKTIEGNLNNTVHYNTYDLADESGIVLGFGCMEAAYTRGVELGILSPVSAEVEPDQTIVSESENEAVLAQPTDANVMALQTKCENLGIAMEIPMEAVGGNANSLMLTADYMDQDILHIIHRQLSSFKTVVGMDLKLMAGDTEVLPDGAVRVSVQSLDETFTNAKKFEVYQYCGVSDSGELQIKKLNSTWDPDYGLSVELNQLSGLVVTYEMPYDGIELETDYGEIHIRLRAPRDVFAVNVGELMLMVAEPDEAMQASIDEVLCDAQSYFAVDIQILCDGNPIQPNGDVQVIFEMKGAPFQDAVEIYHAVEDTEHQRLYMQEVEGGFNDNGDVVMETNHFSTYVVSAVEKRAVTYAAGASASNTWTQALTDRSSNVGVSSEGYSESPYTLVVESKGWQYALGQVTSNTQEAAGGTIVLTKNLQVNEEYWDGEQPFRITSEDPNNPRELTLIRDDWFLENTHAPQGAFKIDNVKLLSTLQYVNIWGRGNKIVIGENVWVNPNKTTRIWGGSDNNNTTTGYPTNVVVLSADWDYVCGGGRKNIPAGTTVTIGGTANVGTLYGGGMENSTVGTPNGENTDVNIFIEGGTVGTLYGGNLVQDRNDAIYEDINIEVSAGNVGILYAGNDYSEMEAGDAEGSFVQGTATVRLTNTGSATRVLGDPYHSAYTRSIKGAAILEVYCNEEFDLMDYWDVVRITGNGSANSTNVSTAQATGGGYIGRMEVTNGGRLYLKQNGYINILNEADGVLTPQNVGSTPYDLKHAWQGESTEERRNLSTLAIEGAAITPSGSYYFDQDAGSAGLRIKGNVEGFSTLEACGEPMYSTGDTYYYYVVADSSDNSGKAFREPEGAPYVVCYRYLEDGRIGWYLRERPVLTMTNSLVRVGTEGTLTPTENGFYTGCPSNYVIMHVDMKGFAYEWSNTSGKNRVEFEWSIFDGYENASKTTGGISLETMADVENNIYSTSNPNGIFANVEYNAMGTDEGSTALSKRVSSFYVIIDTSKAVNPRYYEVSTSFHYIRGEDDYDDLRLGQMANAARCTYDFDKNGDINEGLPSDGYTDSVMTTYEYKNSIPPRGADDALLRVYLPEGVSANTMTVRELDEQFIFEKNGISASLISNSQVAQYYSTEEESTYNHKFGVTLQQAEGTETDLAGGATLNNLSGKENYHCTVYSHEKISFTDITPESNLGLQLQLQLNSLTKGGEAVGVGDPAAVNDGELRIQVYPVGTIFDTTTVTVKKSVTGDNPSTTAEFEFLLSYPKINENGQKVTYEEKFTLKHNEEKTVIIPLETVITIKEIHYDGYFVETETENGELEKNDTVIFTTPDKEHLTNEQLKATFYNTPGAELPESGGTGTHIHTLLGLLLTLGATMLLWMHRREGRAVS